VLGRAEIETELRIVHVAAEKLHQMLRSLFVLGQPEKR
jgi:hypothetical protein